MSANDGIMSAIDGIMSAIEHQSSACPFACILLGTMEQNSQAASTVTPTSLRNGPHHQLLIDTGLLLASERNLDIIVQTACDAGFRLSGAHHGIFLYNNIGTDGEHFTLHRAVGPAAHTFANLAIPPPANFFTDASSGIKTLRSADITGNTHPFCSLPSVHPPVRSYLAASVRSRGGELLGGLFYGHPDRDIFTPEIEDLLAIIAEQVAAALENARLAETLTREIALADAARALQRETAERLRQALEAAQLGTWTWDRATDLLDLDDRAAGMFDAPPHIPITRTELRNRIVTEEDLPQTLQSLEQALASGDLYKAEYRVDRSNGRQTWVASSAVATFDPVTGAIAGMIGTTQDITARKESEANLRQSEKLAATGRLAATIAHEINNPLEAVTNLIYLCKTDPEVPTYAQRLLETADNELARVAQIAQQTLGFYRDTTRPVEIDLNALLHGVVDLFDRKMQSMRIACVLDLAPDLHLFGLQGEIRQVFSNLVVNAIDASPVDSTLRIRARHCRSAQGEGISVLIADQGTGIPQSIRARLFSPFFTTKQTVGTGLGLWVTRGIVEKQGGTIAFRSRTAAPTGTVFRIFLKINDLVAPSVHTRHVLLQ